MEQKNQLDSFYSAPADCVREAAQFTLKSLNPSSADGLQIETASLQDLKEPPVLPNPDGSEAPALTKWKQLQETKPFPFECYYKEVDPATSKRLVFSNVKASSIGNYLGQFLNNKRHGVGRLIACEASNETNYTIIEG